MTPRRSDEIAHRNQLGLLCNARGYQHAVEVGTDRGIFARAFLESWQGHDLYLVDNYAPHPALPFDRSLDAAAAVAALTPFHGRWRFIRANSVDAAPWIARIIPLQFVYIDADHDYESVKADINAWWDLMPEGACLSGHDHDPEHPGVIRAVSEFADRHWRQIQLTSDFPPSWYTFK